MAEELRWVLIVISVFVIGGLLIHGLWSVRKKENAELPASERVEPVQEQQPSSVHTEPQEPTLAQREEPQMSELNFSADEPQIDVSPADTAIEDDLEVVTEEAVDQQSTEDDARGDDGRVAERGPEVTALRGLLVVLQAHEWLRDEGLEAAAVGDD